MTLNVSVDELIDMIADLQMYGDSCDHIGFDPCCVYCQAKRVVQANAEGELRIDNQITEAL